MVTGTSILRTGFAHIHRSIGTGGTMIMTVRKTRTIIAVAQQELARTVSPLSTNGKMRMADWLTIESAPERVEVLTKIHDDLGERNIQIMERIGSLWWLKGRSMYAYYTPTHWKPV